MCKSVYLTVKSFNRPARIFRNALATELKNRGIEVVCNSTNWFQRLFSTHKTYGIAIAIDFFYDKKDGCGLTLNKNCSNLSRDFAYSLSNNLDLLTPQIRWRDFKFVDSYDSEWFRFFNNVSSNTKAIFYLCTYNNSSDVNNYNVAFEAIIKSFADDIIRCLRSNYNYQEYQKRVMIAKLKNKNKDNQ